MKLGTVVYENKIYNLDYMSIEEMKNLLNMIEQDKTSSFKEAKKIVKECSGITAFCHTNSCDTKMLNSMGEIILSGINLWDLHEMIKEVF